MRRLSHLVAVLLLCAGNVAGDAESAQADAESSRGVRLEMPAVPDFDKTKSVGIFVGVQHFPLSEDLTQEPLATVPFAVDDAVDLAHLFSLELSLVEALKVRLVLSGEPAKEESRKRLNALVAAGAQTYAAGQADIYGVLDQGIQSAGPEGVLIVSFATHGFNVRGGQYLLAANSLLNFVEETGVAVERIFDLVSRAPTPRRLLLLDACRERLVGGIRGDSRSLVSAGLATRMARAEGEAILFAARRNGYAYDDNKRGNGVFTASIIDGLGCRSGTDQEGLITIKHLSSYVNKSVREWVQRNIRARPPGPLGIEYQLAGRGADLPLARCTPRVEPEPDRVPPLRASTDAPVPAGVTLEVAGEKSGCLQSAWIAFLDAGRWIWPRVEIRRREFQSSVALPRDFSGGEIALVCVAPETAKMFKDWLFAGNESPLSKPEELAVLMASPVTIQR